MYFAFTIAAWVPDPIHIACGSYVSEQINTETEQEALQAFMKKYPTAIGIKVRRA